MFRRFKYANLLDFIASLSYSIYSDHCTDYVCVYKLGVRNAYVFKGNCHKKALDGNKNHQNFLFEHLLYITLTIICMTFGQQKTRIH